MRVAITGAAGQVGQALIATSPADVTTVALDRDALDISSKPEARRVIRETQAELVINAAAYTAVDRAEEEVKPAYYINRDGVSNLKNAARHIGARLAHISTDFVFDGNSSTPYTPDAETNPLSVYGRSKLGGEWAAGTDALIVRTSWVYAAGGSNFVRTMLRLMREREEVRVVADKVGAPTWATSLAETIWALALQGKSGIWHYTDSGSTSWHGFAEAIAEEALALGLLDRPVNVVPIPSEDYPTPARRPAYSVLDSSATAEALGRPAQHWRENLKSMLKEEQALG